MASNKQIFDKVGNIEGITIGIDSKLDSLISIKDNLLSIATIIGGIAGIVYLGSLVA